MFLPYLSGVVGRDRKRVMEHNTNVMTSVRLI
jgi:hypothetical protein